MNQRRRQLEKLADELNYPVIFPEDVEKHSKKLIITRSDGYKMIYTILAKLDLIDDSNLIKCDFSFNMSGHKPPAL